MTKIQTLHHVTAAAEVDDLELLRQAVEGRIQETGSVQAAAESLGVNRGLLSRIRYGGDSPSVRLAFGIPLRAIPVAPCHECGQIHQQLKHCRPERKRIQHRRAASFETAEEAAAFDLWLVARGLTLSELAQRLVSGELKVSNE